MNHQSDNIPQRVPINNILSGHDTATKAQSMGLNQTRPEYQRHQMISQSIPESERGGTGMFPGSMGPPNYMQYSAGGTYDDGRYSQYAVAEYGMASESSFPQRNGPISQPSTNSNLLDGITAGRTPDTGSAIRQGMPNQEWISGDNRSGQSSSSHQAFEIIEAEAPISKPNTESNNSTSYYACPACSEIAIRVIDSPTRDAMCRNGHVWRFINGKKVA